MFSNDRLILILCGAIAVSCASCSNYRGPKLPPKKPVVPVSGEVRVDGKSAEGVIVTLTPAEPDHGLYQFPTGLTDAEGRFNLGTYANEDGAPEGEYVAIFEWPLPIDEQVAEYDKLKRLYRDSKKSSFKVTVSDEPLVLEPFELKVAGKKVVPLTKAEIDELELRKTQQAVIATAREQ